MGHLDDDAPELVRLVRGADAAHQRAYARAVVRLALERNGLDDPRLAPALAALDAGRSADPSVRPGVERFVAELDELAWDEQDRGAEEEYGVAFMRARAAGAVAAALDDDPETAAYEATYEANAAIEDVPALRAALEGV